MVYDRGLSWQTKQVCFTLVVGHSAGPILLWRRQILLHKLSIFRDMKVFRGHR
jgi:hypothetical protein